MRWATIICLVIFAFIQLGLGVALSPPSLAQEWEFRTKPKGTLRVVDLGQSEESALQNYNDVLVWNGKNNNFIPGLAVDWRWISDRTIDFKLREGVRFHNGEKLNAEAVKINWDAYKKMKAPSYIFFEVIPDETEMQIIDDYTVRFSFPEPDGFALLKFNNFTLHAPAFFREHVFEEGNWGHLPEPGPWGAGPFKLVEGKVSVTRPSERIVLEANEDYWDPQYPKVKTIIFDNTLIGHREEAMRLCMETEGSVDIISRIRPLDTLKVAESAFAKVVKSKDVTTLCGAFNQRKRDSRWRDIRVRQAVNLAINREELWKYAARGNAYNVEGLPLPPGAFGYNPNLAPLEYDTDKARELLAEAGYPDGFEVNLLTFEAWKLEAQIISRMLSRIGLKVKVDVLTRPEWTRKFYVPMLDKPPEEQDWDLSLVAHPDYYGHTGASFLPWIFIEESGVRWIEYDPVYENMWKKMTRTVDRDAQEELIRQMVQYLYERAYRFYVYSPITLYAVNKEVDFVPQKDQFLRLGETSVTENHWSVRGQSE